MPHRALPRRALARAVTALAALLATVAGVVLVPTAAQAATVHYVALGDSYSSGVGAGPYDLSTCLRSQKSYAPLWAAANAVSSFAFPACGGAVTSDVINKQVGTLSAGTTLVTITIGGNDAGFADVITSCRFGSTANCTAAVDKAKASPPRRCPAGSTPPTPRSATGPRTPGWWCSATPGSSRPAPAACWR